jgi:hypothetical protein
MDIKLHYAGIIAGYELKGKLYFKAMILFDFRPLMQTNASSQARNYDLK